MEEEKEVAMVKKDQERYLHLSSLQVEEEKEVAVVKKDYERNVQKNFL